jgi:hypothetical protein
VPVSGAKEISHEWNTDEAKVTVNVGRSLPQPIPVHRHQHRISGAQADRGGAEERGSTEIGQC